MVPAERIADGDFGKDKMVESFLCNIWLDYVYSV